MEFTVARGLCGLSLSFTARQQATAGFGAAGIALHCTSRVAMPHTRGCTTERCAQGCTTGIRAMLQGDSRVQHACIVQGLPAWGADPDGQVREALSTQPGRLAASQVAWLMTLRGCASDSTTRMET